MEFSTNLAIDPTLFVVGVLSLAVLYVPFSPMTIDLLPVSRRAQVWIYQNRNMLWGLAWAALGLLVMRSIAGFLLAAGGEELAGFAEAGKWFKDFFGAADPMWLWISGVTIAGTVAAFWGGYVPYVMTPPTRQKLCDIAAADQYLGPDDVVLGLTIDGVARAYPRDAIARPHYFTDEINGTPLMISYCILCNSAIAFHRQFDGRMLNLKCLTAYNNNIIYFEPDRGNFIQQLDGNIFHGPDAGRALEPVPLLVTSWREWKSLYPDTGMYFAPATTIRDRMVALMLQMMIPISRLSRRTRPWHRVRGALDERLPAMSFVYGIEIGDDSTVFPTPQASDDSRVKVAVNELVGGAPVVFLFDEARTMGQIFSREVDGKVLTFFRSDEDTGDTSAVARDEESGSLWDVAGRAISGPYSGKSLNLLPHFNKIFWFSWALFKPGTRITGVT